MNTSTLVAYGLEDLNTMAENLRNEADKVRDNRKRLDLSTQEAKDLWNNAKALDREATTLENEARRRSNRGNIGA